MLFRFFNFLGGNTFGTGVTYSVLKMVGHTPCLIAELRTFVTGVANSLENFLMMAVGMSPDGKDVIDRTVFISKPQEALLPEELNDTTDDRQTDKHCNL